MLILRIFFRVGPHETPTCISTTCAVTIISRHHLFVKTAVCSHIWLVLYYRSLNHIICWWTTPQLGISLSSGMLGFMLNTIETIDFIKGHFLLFCELTLTRISSCLIGNKYFSAVSFLFVRVSFDSCCFKLSLCTVISRNNLFLPCLWMRKSLLLSPVWA